ncbi:IclR family transcriptional regulator [Leucobacter allii]|uniref:IclR family transcriptional regulator n=1 Tax=Leucobacter allii TaxID=2932247 RepID=UPI001FD2B8A5|nr:IclR family transcriptional regulator [Leucobacter allii]UOR02180.1 IclR family transcriptional regulator [Leucobacter allii]
MAKITQKSDDAPEKKSDGLLNRAVKVLRVVSTFPHGVGLSELARLADVPKASCFRIITVLEAEGILFTDEDTKRTRISVGALSIVGGLLTQSGMLRAVRDILADLSTASGETTGFDVLQGEDIVVLMQNVGPSLIGQTLKQTPRTQPPWLTSTGKALLAHRDPDAVRELLAPRYPQENLHQLDLFIESLEPARVHGYAWLYGALERDAASVAAPVMIDGLPKYALWIGGPTYRITPDNARQLGQLAIEAAEKTARLLTASREAQGFAEPLLESGINGAI